ncbi:hypothetical protein [Bradyrhizobium sp. UFLA05-112]
MSLVPCNLERSARWPGLSILAGHSSVRVASTDEELGCIGRLRYQRFVVEQAQPYAVAGADRTLLDPIDPVSLNLFIGNGATISVALRMSWSVDVVASDYLSLLRGSLPADIACGKTIICSRLIVASSERADLANLVVILRRAYEIGVLSGCTHSVLSTLPHRVPLFERIGYCRSGTKLDDPVAGPQDVLILDLADIAHMRSVGSPLVASRRRLKRAPLVTAP